MQNKLRFLVFLLLFSSLANAQTLYFPPLTGNTWDTLSPVSLGWCPDKVAPLLDYLGEKNTKAFILLKDGKIVIEKYYGSFTADSLWYWASAGKTLTAFVTGIAQQEGHLSIQDTTSQYLGTGWTICPAAKEEKITIRTQLTMTSGLDDGVADPYCTLDTCLQYKADAGTRWAYHNGPYTLLDGVIEAATGQTLNSYFTQKVKTVTGMTGAFFPSGYNNVFFSKPRSMARFGLLMLNKGNWNGNQIMTDTAYFHQMVNSSQNLNPSYGYLWWLNGKSNFMAPGFQFTFPGPLNVSAPSDMIAALGKNGQIINIVPDQNLVYIRMGDAPGVGEVPISFNDTIWQKLNDLMCTPSSIEPTLDAFSFGIYPNPATNDLIIKNPKNILILKTEITDLQGRIFGSQIWNQTSPRLDVSLLTSGIYLLKIYSEEGVFLQKFIIKEQ